MDDAFYAEVERISKTLSIAQMTSSITSLFSSLLILFIIFRSHKKLTTTFNRLLLGLSISDVISSLAQAFVTIPSPPSHVVGWITVGNMALCRTQGALYSIGAIASPLYNCSICIYYLIEIKFTQYIPSMNRIERYLHAVPILISLTTSISLLAIDAFSPMLTHCFVSAYPLGCEYDESIDCERGLEYKSAPALFIILMLFQIAIPVIIIGSMILIYRDVATQEARMSRFSFTLRRSRAIQNKIAARNRAIAYSVACLLTMIWFFVIVNMTLFSGVGYVPRWLSVVHYTFSPLQGFFNLIVFLQPRVQKYWRIHKRSHGNNLIKVFYLAIRDSILSRGSPIGRRSVFSLTLPLGRGSIAVTGNGFEEEGSIPVVPSDEVSRASTGEEGQDPPNSRKVAADDSSANLSPNKNNASSLKPSDEETVLVVKLVDDHEVLQTSFHEEQGQNKPDCKIVADPGFDAPLP